MDAQGLEVAADFDGGVHCSKQSMSAARKAARKACQQLVTQRAVAADFGGDAVSIRQHTAAYSIRMRMQLCSAKADPDGGVHGAQTALYFCTSKARKVSTCADRVVLVRHQREPEDYLEHCAFVVDLEAR